MGREDEGGGEGHGSAPRRSAGATGAHRRSPSAAHAHSAPTEVPPKALEGFPPESPNIRRTSLPPKKEARIVADCEKGCRVIRLESSFNQGLSITFTNMNNNQALKSLYMTIY